MVPVRLPPGHTAIQRALQQLLKPIHLVRLCQRPSLGNRLECLAICSHTAFDCWPTERDQPLDVIDSAAREQSASMRKKKSQERKPGNANAGPPDRHETAHAELTGAGGSHSSSTCRVRHCWLA